ncbi:hypothetical protein M0R19_04890 [Candidatus Pacearchaeota archaeon]|nr:hypothetical protein [Candidatus Pacearchaeota archaeon]
MTKDQEVLRLCCEFLMIIYYRTPVEKREEVLIKQCKTIADLCGMRLPNKYKFTREELDKIKGLGIEEKSILN